MDSNVDSIGVSNVTDTKCCSSKSTEDNFDMKSCEEALNGCGKNAVSSKTAVDSDEEYSDAIDESCDETVEDLDEEYITESHKNLTEDELQKLKTEATELKTEGNEYFKKGEYKESILLYTRALNTCPLNCTSERSVFFANRAAARISLDLNDDAILDCNKAIELNPNYLKVILRRAQLHKKMDNLERCLEDYQKVMELDRNNAEARQACATLPSEIQERNEKLKTEMFGKLKELGNMCLKPFGMSTDNFKVIQDPQSGGYSINFQNNQS